MTIDTDKVEQLARESSDKLVRELAADLVASRNNVRDMAVEAVELRKRVDLYADMLTVARALAESVANACPRMHPSTDEADALDLARQLVERLRALSPHVQRMLGKVTR